MVENRRSFRLPFRTKVVFGGPKQIIAGNTMNISAGGLYVMALESVPRDSIYKLVFSIDPKEDPIVTEVQVKRIVSPSENLEETPGVGLSFTDNDTAVLNRINNFMQQNRRNFEMASAILASGEPELTSLEPLVRQMHLPPVTDLGHLRFYVERILKVIELIDKGNATQTEL